ncbi:MAG: 16S rRNA (guanine(966)-N(2))-methyltransferase RsmD [Betaproteobacteria bacterium]|nr:16S rRNA (guanine(966)-N(2))-methyltransferase RsmD [Betaproteobacteria bacterium]NDD12744.1 16S rRNA (guanine(966)-N(2))-methyltransferase RsmD [Betaproteobacteria bacterium]
MANLKPPGEVRIIGGQWKRTRLKVADMPGLRPSPDRVRETLFNWLGQDLTGWVAVDAFAGTGALGLEAASRGAKQVLLIEQNAQLVTQLKTSIGQLNAQTVQVIKGDGVHVLQQCAPGTVDVVFLDPPFEAKLFEPALKAAASAIAPQGFVYLEAPELWSDQRLWPLGFKGHKHLKAGAVYAHLIQKNLFTSSDFN